MFINHFTLFHSSMLCSHTGKPLFVTFLGCHLGNLRIISSLNFTLLRCNKGMGLPVDPFFIIVYKRWSLQLKLAMITWWKLKLDLPCHSSSTFGTKWNAMMWEFHISITSNEWFSHFTTLKIERQDVLNVLMWLLMWGWPCFKDCHRWVNGAQGGWEVN